MTITIEKNQKVKINNDFNVNRKLRYAIHRDWGLYYKKLKLLSPAVENLEKSHSLNQHKLRPLLEKSRCNLEKSLIQPLAMNDVKRCKMMYPNAISVKDHFMECNYELNEFEEALKIANNTKNEHHTAGRNCKKNIEIIENTLKMNIGPEAGPCLYRFRKIINHLQRIDERKIIDNRPFWKILRDNRECDVIDLREKIVKNRTSLEDRRKHQHTQFIHNTYFDLNTAKDIMFIKKMSAADNKNSSLHLPQIPFGSESINRIFNEYSKRIDSWEQMLWARQPIYAKQFAIENLPNYKGFKENSLLCMQAETRKSIFKQLVEIKRLFKLNEHLKMLNYAETVLSEYYSIKTNRIFLRKFEFINEICNIIGLSYLNKLKVPSNLMEFPIDKRLSYLFMIPVAVAVNDDCNAQFNVNDDDTDNISNNNGIRKDKTISQKRRNKNKIGMSKEKQFDNRLTFVDPDEPDWNYLKYKNLIDYYEKRILNSMYAIEKTYLYHESAKLHLKQHKLDATKQMAKKIIEQSYECGNYVWIFLGYLMLIRCEHASNNRNSVAFALDKSLLLAGQLNETIVHFVQTARILNKTEIDVEMKNEDARKRSRDKQQKLKHTFL